MNELFELSSARPAPSRRGPQTVHSQTAAKSTLEPLAAAADGGGIKSN